MKLDLATLKFLEAVKENNNTKWMHEHKDLYVMIFDGFKKCIASYIAKLQQIDGELEGLDIKQTVFRFNKDIRFSKDKSPYKGYFGAYVAAGGKKSPRAGIYIHIEPGGKSMIAGGLWQPMSPILFKVREKISQEYDRFLKIIGEKKFKKLFLKIAGEKIVRVPRGFDKDDIALPYLLQKSYIVSSMIPDGEILDDEFFEKCFEYYMIMKPFFDFLNEVFDEEIRDEKTL